MKKAVLRQGQLLLLEEILLKGILPEFLSSPFKDIESRKKMQTAATAMTTREEIRKKIRFRLLID